MPYLKAIECCLFIINSLHETVWILICYNTSNCLIFTNADEQIRSFRCVSKTIICFCVLLYCVNAFDGQAFGRDCCLVTDTVEKVGTVINLKCSNTGWYVHDLNQLMELSKNTWDVKIISMMHGFHCSFMLSLKLVLVSWGLCLSYCACKKISAMNLWTVGHPMQSEIADLLWKTRGHRSYWFVAFVR